MEAPFQSDTLLWYWHQYYLALGGLVVSALVLTWALFRTPWTLMGVLPRVLLLGAAAATVPLALTRLGVETQVLDVTDSGLLSLMGTGTALVLGVPFLLLAGRIGTPELVDSLKEQWEAVRRLFDYFDTKLDSATTSNEQMTAIALLMTELPRILKATSSLRPRSLAGRRATGSLKKAISSYISGATSLDNMFQELRKGVMDVDAADGTTRPIRKAIAERISPTLKSVRGAFDRTANYLEPFTRASAGQVSRPR